MTPGLDATNTILAAIEQLCASSTKVMQSYIADMEDFRERVSKKLLVVCRELDELRELFVEFEAQANREHKNWTVFSDRKTLFDQLPTIKVDTIINCIQNDLQRANVQLKSFSD